MQERKFVFMAEEGDETAVKALEFIAGNGKTALYEKGVFCGKISARVIKSGVKLTDILIKEHALPIPVFRTSGEFMFTKSYDLPFQEVPKWGRGSSRVLAVPKEFSEKDLFNALLETVIC